jgi:O-antigen biosynthesis protein WbqV
MTVREAVELVLQVAANRLGSEEQRGCIFVLDMGEPVRIFDMAEQMVRLTGLTPHKDVKIEIVGLRPGEKLIEELFDACEERLPSSLTGVLRARSRQVDLGRLRFTMAQLEGICQRRDELALQRLLAHWVPGYRRHAASGGGDAVVDAFIAPTFTQWIARDRKTALSEQV